MKKKGPSYSNDQNVALDVENDGFDLILVISKDAESDGRAGAEGRASIEFGRRNQKVALLVKLVVTFLILIGLFCATKNTTCTASLDEITVSYPTTWDAKYMDDYIYLDAPYYGWAHIWREESTDNGLSSEEYMNDWITSFVDNEPAFVEKTRRLKVRLGNLTTGYVTAYRYPLTYKNDGRDCTGFLQLMQADNGKWYSATALVLTGQFTEPAQKEIEVILDSVSIDTVHS